MVESSTSQLYCEEKVKVGFLTRYIRNNLCIFAGIIIVFAFDGCSEVCGMLCRVHSIYILRYQSLT